MCIAIACTPDAPEPGRYPLQRKHKRAALCPLWKNVPIKERWEYLYSLEYQHEEVANFGKRHGALGRGGASFHVDTQQNFSMALDIRMVQAVRGTSGEPGGILLI
jgi:hypothetical protein